MMMYFWWLLLIISSALLAILLLRNPFARHWLGYLALHIVFAAVALFFVNLFGERIQLHIPINLATVATIGILGIPGILLLVALKLLLF